MLTNDKPIEKKSRAKETKSFEQEVFQHLGDFKTKLVKEKLKDQNLKKIISDLLLEWASGRIKL